MESRVLDRYFSFQSLKLPDPDPKLPPEEVRALYSHQYPDLATATITGPELIGDKLVFSFSRAIGSKG